MFKREKAAVASTAAVEVSEEEMRKLEVSLTEVGNVGKSSMLRFSRWMKKDMKEFFLTHGLDLTSCNDKLGASKDVQEPCIACSIIIDTKRGHKLPVLRARQGHHHQQFSYR